MVLNGFDRPLSHKMEVVTNYLTNSQYSYKQASIVFFKSHGPQMLNTSVLMVLFESFGHVCDSEYSKINHFGIFVVQD